MIDSKDYKIIYNKINFGTAKGCRVYIDHDARVYHDWKSYLTENKLPKGVLVVPKNGEYRGIILNVSMLQTFIIYF